MLEHQFDPVDRFQRRQEFDGFGALSIRFGLERLHHSRVADGKLAERQGSLERGDRIRQPSRFRPRPKLLGVSMLMAEPGNRELLVPGEHLLHRQCAQQIAQR